MLVVTSSSPEVTDLLGPDLGVDLMRWAGKRRSRDLKDRQRRRVLTERLSYAGYQWNKRWERKSAGSAGKQSREKGSRVHNERMNDNDPSERVKCCGAVERL